MEIKNKVVVITGVSRGIGKELVKQFLEKGSRVMGLGRTKPEINHDKFSFYKTDIRNEDEVKVAFKAILEAEGNEIHILVNNAGLGYFDLVEDVPSSQIHQMFETNVYGLLYCCQQAVPVMKEAGIGHIINIGSIASLEAYPQVSVYCGTKFAVRGISQSMYKELRDFGVKVTCVYPGSVKTNFFDEVDSIDAHDYMLMPEDVASVIVHATETPDNFHQVNLEIRPLQPKGPRK